MNDGELQFVAWLRKHRRSSPAVRLGIGDDMAVVTCAPDSFLLSSDILLDGVHFDTTTQPLEAIGRKAVACGLSDCAAMAVLPVAAVVSVALTRSMSIEDAQRLYHGITDIADAFDLAVVGGDTTCWDQPLVIDVAITAAPYPEVEPVRRDGARAGDTLYVTGPLGGSRLGKHLAFTPRVREAHRIAASLGRRLNAMIDISDGLSLDLHRICAASQVGARLEETELERIVSDDARRAAERDGRSPMDHVLSDGEDYELLLAVAGEVSHIDVPLQRIGTVADSGLQLVGRDGRSSVLEPVGFTH